MTMQSRLAALISAVGADVKALQAGGGGGGAAQDPWTYIFLPSTVSVSTTAFADVTGLAFAAVANVRYEVEVFGAIQSAATTTGAALALKIPSGTIVGQGVQNVTAPTLGGFEQIADNTTSGATSGVRAVSTNTPLTSRFLVSVGATGGAVQLRLRSEIAASAVALQAGTMLKYRIASTAAASPPRLFVPITQADYDALSPPDAGTLYVIVTGPAGGAGGAWVELTQAAYTALSPPSPGTLYIVIDP